VTGGVVVLPPDPSREAVAAAFADAWARLVEDAGPGTNQKARQLFRDWLRVDAVAAIRFVSEPPGMLSRRGGIFLLTALAETDPEEASRIAFQSGLESTASSEAVFKVWGSRNPMAAFAFSEQNLPAHRRLAAETGILAGWAAVAGSEAFAWLQSQPKGWRKDQLMSRMALGMLQNSPNDLVQLMKEGSMPPEMKSGLQRLEEYHDSDRVLNTVQAALTAGADAKELLALANHITAPGLAIAVMTAAVQAAAPGDANDVAKLAAMLNPDRPDYLLRGLGRAAPAAGLAWALENDLPLNDLAESWAEHDAAGALGALLGQARGGRADEAMRRIMPRAAASAPAEAIEAMLQVEFPASERRKHLSAAARVLARSDPGQAVLALGRIPDAPPEEVSAVLAISGRTDAKAAAAALAECDLATDGYIAAESLTRGWAVADPVAASEWVRTLPQGELRDGGAAGLARSVMEGDPVAAFTWALEVNEPGIRDRIALQAAEKLKEAQTLERMEADARLSDAARAALRSYWSSSIPDK
jgi:hypothetical protein